LKVERKWLRLIEDGMSEPKTNDESSAKPSGEVAPAKSAETNPAAAGEPAAPGQLSKEEQWALFEKELKESDWGHQPC
jgi:hypothetical protein